MTTRLRCLMVCSVLSVSVAAARADDDPGLITGGHHSSAVIKRSSVFSWNEDINTRSQIYTLWGLYSEGFIPIPPYFALHPPVYYSAPIPRTYGYSPFAYPPGVMTPELQLGEVTQPETMHNPYVTPPDGPIPAAAGRTAMAPLRIVNPFIESPDVQLAHRPAE
jgi:hypothetical protein